METENFLLQLEEFIGVDCVAAKNGLKSTEISKLLERSRYFEAKACFKREQLCKQLKRLDEAIPNITSIRKKFQMRRSIIEKRSLKTQSKYDPNHANEILNEEMLITGSEVEKKVHREETFKANEIHANYLQNPPLSCASITNTMNRGNGSREFEPSTSVEEKYTGNKEGGNFIKNNVNFDDKINSLPIFYKDKKPLYLKEIPFLRSYSVDVPNQSMSLIGNKSMLGCKAAKKGTKYNIRLFNDSDVKLENSLSNFERLGLAQANQN